MIAELVIALELALVPPLSGAVSTSPSSDAMTQFLATLSPGQWGQVPNTSISSVCYPQATTAPDFNSSLASAVNNGSFGGSAQNCLGTFIQWGSVAFDPANGRAFMSAGGHDGYYGNEIYAFSTNDLKWERWTTPGNSTTTPYTEGPTGQYVGFQNGDPFPQHNYGSLQYLPAHGSQGSLYFGSPTSNGGSCVNTDPGFNTPACGTSAFIFDIAHKPSLCAVTNGLVPCAATPQGIANGSGWFDTSTNPSCVGCVRFEANAIAGVDPVTGKVWMTWGAIGGGAPTPTVYDPATDTWSFPVTTGDHVSTWGEMSGAVRTPTRELWAISDNNTDEYGATHNIMRINMGTGVSTRWSIPMTLAYFQGFTYDSAVDRLVTMPGTGGGNIQVIDPTQNPPTATIVTTTGGGSIPNVSCNGSLPCTNGILGRFFYDSNHHCFVYLHLNNDDVWVLKPNAGL